MKLVRNFQKAFSIALLLSVQLSNGCIRMTSEPHIYKIKDCKNIKVPNFTSWDNIYVVVASENKISSIKEKTFEGGEAIEEIYLHENSIQEIEWNAFTNIRNLNILTLTRNKINYIKSGSFDNMTNSKFLLLSENTIKEIEVNLFNSLVKLEILWLAATEISELKRGEVCSINL